MKKSINSMHIMVIDHIDGYVLITLRREDESMFTLQKR